MSFPRHPGRRYSGSSQQVINLGDTGTQAMQLISKLDMVAILYFGA